MVDLTTCPEPFFDGPARLPGPMLLMLDRITAYWPDAGGAGLGRLRAEKDVDPGEWFFKAHFFQDPVQPGSLGVEAMCRLLHMTARPLRDTVGRVEHVGDRATETPASRATSLMPTVGVECVMCVSRCSDPAQ